MITHETPHATLSMKKIMDKLVRDCFHVSIENINFFHGHTYGLPQTYIV
jgi:hypothetical protein